MITAGIDVGARYVKMVILNDGKILAKDRGLVGFDVLKSASEVFENMLKPTGF